MNIIVAGGCGFLGSHLCEYLLLKGDTVWCIDNLSTGRRENIAHLEHLPQLRYWKWDVREPYDGPDIDRIYNMACPASPNKYMDDPLGTIATCYKGALNALRVGARVLQASTSEVYGDPKMSPQPETYHGDVNCWGPRACYDEGKRIAETVCYEHRDKVEVRVARIFNTYGPRMDCSDGRVIPEFICAALENRPIVIHGDGNQTRSFCYVSDMVRGLEALMESDEDEPTNVGNPDEHTVLSIAYKIVSMIDTSSEIQYVRARPDDPRQRKPDITKAYTLFGWRPEVDLDTGLKNTIEYFSRVKVGV